MANISGFKDSSLLTISQTFGIRYFQIRLLKCNKHILSKEILEHQKYLYYFFSALFLCIFSASLNPLLYPIKQDETKQKLVVPLNYRDFKKIPRKKF